MESMRWVGVDVRAMESLGAVLGKGDLGNQYAANQWPTSRSSSRVAATLAQPFRAVYEAEPTENPGLTRFEPLAFHGVGRVTA